MMILGELRDQPKEPSRRIFSSFLEGPFIVFGFFFATLKFTFILLHLLCGFRPCIFSFALVISHKLWYDDNTNGFWYFVVRFNTPGLPPGCVSFSGVIVLCKISDYHPFPSEILGERGFFLDLPPISIFPQKKGASQGSLFRPFPKFSTPYRTCPLILKEERIFRKVPCIFIIPYLEYFIQFSGNFFLKVWQRRRKVKFSIK